MGFSLPGLIGGLFKFIKKYLIPLLIILAIVICVFFPLAIPAILEFASVAWGWLASSAGAVATFFAELGIQGSIAAALGIGLLVDPEGTSAAIGNIIDAGGEVVGGVLGDVLSALGSSPMLMIAAAVGAYMLFSSDDSDSSGPSGEIVLKAPDDQASLNRPAETSEKPRSWRGAQATVR